MAGAANPNVRYDAHVAAGLAFEARPLSKARTTWDRSSVASFIMLSDLAALLEGTQCKTLLGIAQVVMLGELR